MEKKKKTTNRTKILVPYIIDETICGSRIIMLSNNELLEYVKNEIIGRLRDGQEHEYTIGAVKMTQKQLINLPDLDA